MDFYNIYNIFVKSTVIVLLCWGLIFVVLQFIKKYKNKITKIKFKISNINPKEEISKEIDKIFIP